MNDLPDKDGMNINVKHKTWTPEDQIKYEKEMTWFKIKISALLVGGSILLFSIITILLKFLIK